MKSTTSNKWKGFLVSLSMVCVLTGCASRQYLATEEVCTKSGKGWAETESVQKYRDSTGRLKDKQVVYEKVRCTSKKNGKLIPAETVEECLKRGGQIVDEVKTSEEEFGRR